MSDRFEGQAEVGCGSTPIHSIMLSTPSADAPYSSKIIKAGALFSDTKTLLLQWDTSATVQANLARFRQENVFGKASRSRVGGHSGDLPPALSYRCGSL